MRYGIILFVLLSGCAGTYDLTLFPRGGGAQAKGVGDAATKTMTVTLNGKTYSGNYVQASSRSAGSMAQGANMPATAVGVSSSNQFTALLAGEDGAIRCEFMASRSAGNGVCTDSQQRSYDLLIRAK